MLVRLENERGIALCSLRYHPCIRLRYSRCLLDFLAHGVSPGISHTVYLTPLQTARKPSPVVGFDTSYFSAMGIIARSEASYSVGHAHWVLKSATAYCDQKGLRAESRVAQLCVDGEMICGISTYLRIKYNR